MLPFHPDAVAGPRLVLLNGWRLTAASGSVIVPMNAQRLVALLALTGPQTRASVAGTLWPDQSERRAGGSLRSTLWRLHEACRDTLETAGQTIALRPEVSVDVEEFVAGARRILAGGDDRAADYGEILTDAGDLLPGWYDEWVLLERERLRQLRIHALEALADQLTAAGRFATALEAAMAAVKVEPLRESANRTVLRIHLAENNSVEAIRYFERFRELLLDELGLEPSEQMAALVRPLVRRFGEPALLSPRPPDPATALKNGLRREYRPGSGRSGHEVE